MDESRPRHAHTSKTILVTGASTGIGAATVLELDQRGHRVFAGVRKLADAERLASMASDRLTPVILDVTDATSICTAQEEITVAVGSAGLVNNAGIVVSGPLELLPIDELRRQLETNVIGQVAVTQAFTPLSRQARGRIVNIGSSAKVSLLRWRRDAAVPAALHAAGCPPRLAGSPGDRSANGHRIVERRQRASRRLSATMVMIRKTRNIPAYTAMTRVGSRSNWLA